MTLQEGDRVTVLHTWGPVRAVVDVAPDPNFRRHDFRWRTNANGTAVETQPGWWQTGDRLAWARLADEGVKWCRGWDTDAARLLQVAHALLTP